MYLASFGGDFLIFVCFSHKELEVLVQGGVSGVLAACYMKFSCTLAFSTSLDSIPFWTDKILLFAR